MISLDISLVFVLFCADFWKKLKIELLFFSLAVAEANLAGFALVGCLAFLTGFGFSSPFSSVSSIMSSSASSGKSSSSKSFHFTVTQLFVNFNAAVDQLNLTSLTNPNTLFRFASRNFLVKGSK